MSLWGGNASDEGGKVSSSEQQQVIDGPATYSGKDQRTQKTKSTVTIRITGKMMIRASLIPDPLQTEWTSEHSGVLNNHVVFV